MMTFLTWLRGKRTLREWWSSAVLHLRFAMARPDDETTKELDRAVGFTPVDPRWWTMSDAELGDMFERVCDKAAAVETRLETDYQRRYGKRRDTGRFALLGSNHD